MFTRSAASPYFWRTASFNSMLIFSLILLAYLGNLAGLNGFVAGAALGVEETEQFLQESPCWRRNGEKCSPGEP